MAASASAAQSQRRQQTPKQQDLKTEQFAVVQGMETREQRDALAPGFWSWLLNFQPVGRRTLRALNGKGPTLYTAPTGDSILWYGTCVIGSAFYAIVFLASGKADQVALVGGAVTHISATSDTFYSGSGAYPHFTPFGNNGIVVVSPNGYWAWDGATLYAENAQAPTWLSGLTTVPTPTGTATNGSANITGLTSTTGLAVGMGPFLSGFAAGTIITTIVSSSEVTVSNSFTGVTVTGTITFNWPMPSGISGTAVEVYNASPWIVNGRTILASAPGNGADFATSGGAVNLTVKDAYVQSGYTGIRQLDGFLYLFAAAAVDVISDVQTSGSPASTTFLRVNVSPLIGSPWRDTIVPLPSSIAFTNPTGVFEVAGGQARKVSEPFDGIFEDATFQINPSATIVTLNETTCYGFTVTVNDPDTGASGNCLGLWDGKRWFLATQETQPIIAATQDNGSNLAAWGSDGATIFEMFALASATLTKKAKSWFAAGDSGITMRKMIERVYAQFANIPDDAPFSDFTIDTESQSVAVTSISTPVLLQFINALGQNLSFTNASGATLAFATAVYPLIVAGGVAGVVALIFGITFESTIAAIDIINVTIGFIEYSRWE